MLVVTLGVVAPQLSPEPVVIVDDAAAIRRAVGGHVDAVFTPTRDEAEAPRKDLARYLAAERKREKDGYRRTQLHQIETNIDRYFWHCGGYVKDKQKYLYCSFVLIGRPSDLASLRQKHFPAIDDGGTSVCNCTFSLKSGHIVRLDWNGEA
jgi:hypothetical protein